MNPVIKKFQFGQSTVTLETGRIARQASGAVLVTVDDDVTVLVTVVGAKTADPSKGFFPLSVHYQEKTYAAGKIPGGFFKREARPSEKETLTSRLIDRPINLPINQELKAQTSELSHAVRGSPCRSRAGEGA